MPKITRTLPCRVDFIMHDEDFQVALLGSMGFSTTFIQKETGLTEGQVSYRLSKAAIKRKDYRDGESGEAEMVIATLTKKMSRELVKKLDELK
jgi:hypothetical protein